MTEPKPCECGADDYNARLPPKIYRQMPHALNCPKRPKEGKAA